MPFIFDANITHKIAIVVETGPNRQADDGTAAQNNHGVDANRKRTEGGHAVAQHLRVAPPHNPYTRLVDLSYIGSQFGDVDEV